MTLVYANIAISQQLLRFNSLKNIFLRFIGLKGLKMVWKKKFPDLKYFSLILAEKPCFSLISLTGKSLQKSPWIPWFPWSVGTLFWHILQLQFLSLVLTIFCSSHCIGWSGLLCWDVNLKHRPVRYRAYGYQVQISIVSMSFSSYLVILNNVSVFSMTIGIIHCIIHFSELK